MGIQILHKLLQLLCLLRDFSVQFYDICVIIFLRPGRIRSRLPALCLFLLLPRLLLRTKFRKLCEQVFPIYLIENRSRFHPVTRRHTDLLHKQTVQSDHRLRIDRFHRPLRRDPVSDGRRRGVVPLYPRHPAHINHS